MQSWFIDNSRKNCNLYILRIQIVVHQGRQTANSSLPLHSKPPKNKSLVAVWVIRVVKVVKGWVGLADIELFAVLK